METVIGLRGLDFVILACDTMLAKSIYFVKDNSSKIRRLSKNSMMGVVGNNGDTLQFADFISSNLSLYEVQNGYPMNMPALCHFTCTNIAIGVRNNSKFRVAMLLAGYDLDSGPCLTFVDSLGATQTLNYSGHGLGHALCISIFHMLWKPNLTFQEGHKIICKCIQEIQKHLIVNLRYFDVYVVDKDGFRKLDTICSKSNDLPQPNKFCVCLK